MKPEDDPKGFLVLIVKTITAILMWMMLQVLIGIYFEYGFFETSPDVFNYLYYVFLIVSFYLLVRYLIKKWR